MSDQTPVLECTGSHSVSAVDRVRIDKEQVFGYFACGWRGQRVRVIMRAERHIWAGHDEWSAWNIVAEDAHVIDEASNGGRGTPSTPTARTRLAEQCRPLMLAWLEGRVSFAVEQSADYAQSRAGAYRRFLARTIADTTAGERSIAATRELVRRYSDEVPAGTVLLLGAALDALEVFAAALRAVSDTEGQQ